MKAFARGQIYILIENQWIGRVSSLVSTLSVGVAMLFAMTASGLSVARPAWPFPVLCATLLLAALTMTPLFATVVKSITHALKSSSFSEEAPTAPKKSKRLL
jgi:hypothetical protein